MACLLLIPARKEYIETLMPWFKNLKHIYGTNLLYQSLGVILIFK